MFTLVGAWCGAFVIPLDWDKSWQVNIYIGITIPTSLFETLVSI